MAEGESLDSHGLQLVWNNIVSCFLTSPQGAVLTGAIGMHQVMIDDLGEAVQRNSDYISDLQSYFDGDIAKKAKADEDGKSIKSTYLPFTGGTIYKSGENFPLIIRGGVASQAGIQFYSNSNSLLGSIRVTSTNIQYYNGSYRNIWHEGNAGVSTIDWACRDLNASRDVIAARGVAAGGHADISVSEAGLSGAVTSIQITDDSTSPHNPQDGLVTLPAYPVWSTLVGKPTFGTAAWKNMSDFTPAALPVTTMTGTSWIPDKGAAPSIMYQLITANHTLDFRTADSDGVGCLHYIVLNNTSSSAKTVTIQRGSQGLAIARESGSISVPANSTLLIEYIAISENFYVIDHSVLTIDHP